MKDSFMDDFIRKKLGERKEMDSSELDLETEDEYFTFVHASMRMMDGSALDCPFTMILKKVPSETKAGRYLVPNSVIKRKRRCLVRDSGDPRLIGDKRRMCCIEDDGK